MQAVGDLTPFATMAFSAPGIDNALETIALAIKAHVFGLEGGQRGKDTGNG